MAAAEVLTPSQLNTLARDLLEDSFPLIWVEGELGQVTRPASGHLYLTLKDARAQVRAAMFKPKSTWLKFQPRQGMRVLARGRLTLYEARGDCQLVLDHLEEAGEGDLRRALERLRAQLEAEGLFAVERKRPLPAWPRRIGLLTSPSGAVVRDVISVLRRRFPLLEVDVLPVPVQGADAAARIHAMLTRTIASGRHDVLLLARGGGSLEDLLPFNDERLARAIAAAPVPVVSAIGHETDFSLSDFAADLRAPTPSVAAELLTPDQHDLRARLSALKRRLRRGRREWLQQRMQRLDRAGLRLRALHPQQRLQLLRHRQYEALRRLRQAMQTRLRHGRERLLRSDAMLRTVSPRRRLQDWRQRLARLRPRPRQSLATRLQRERLRLHGLARSLEATSPLATIARGYSILQHPDGRVVCRIGDAAAGDILDARLRDGRLRLRVEDDDGQRDDRRPPRRRDHA